MKKLGLIGGTSWHSTIEYYRNINQMVEAMLPQPPKNPELLLYSINVDLMRRNNWTEIENYYLTISNTLINAGAEAIIICANTPHKVYDFVQPKIDVPILHIADAIGKECVRLGVKTVGQMGTIQVTEEDFISKPLREKYDVETLQATAEMRQQMDWLIKNELTRGIFTENSVNYFKTVMNHHAENGAQAMILGCTEIPILLRDIKYNLPLIDTTMLHSKLAADFIVG
ncbi:MAG: amino acid racemase [Bacteroidetes bacterium]|nr:amino acid racemase [Bacteroidota bacterium]